MNNKTVKAGLDAKALEPCPFCGGTDSTDNACQEAAVHPLEFKAPTGQRAYRVVCVCGAQSGADTNYFKAIEAWNHRSALPHAGVSEEMVKAAFLEGRGNWVYASAADRGEKEWMESQAFAALSSQHAEAAPVTFQERVQPWMMACFGPEISGDRVERADRLLEEVFELLQSGGYDPARVLALRDYVWGREIGEPAQEVGGVMVTLAAYCLAHDLDMHQAGETELARIWTKVEKIREKQSAKPKHSPLPVAASPVPAYAGEPGIKALEWAPDADWSGLTSGVFAPTPFGRYGVELDAFSYSPTIAYYATGPFVFRHMCASEEAAKAAAQADYEARIRSTLVPTTSPAKGGAEPKRPEDLRDENARLRVVISKVCDALPNGAFCSPECSIEFMECVPSEVAAVCAALRTSAPVGQEQAKEGEANG